MYPSLTVSPGRDQQLYGKPQNDQYLDSEADPEFISAQIRSHELAISTIDQEIGEHMRTIRQLQFKKWEHSEGIRRCKGLITLARRLPAEILATICEICVRDGYTRTPLVISHVCSQWREAARVPSIWSHIYVDFDGPDPYGRTGFWLAKAENSYLHIMLEIRQEQVTLLEVVGLLLRKKLQWCSLTIKSAFLSNVNQVLTMCKGPFPELRVFCTSVQQEFSENDDQIGENETRELVGLRTAFLEAPNLSVIRISRNILPGPNILPPSIRDLSLALPSDHFTHNLSISSILRILEGLPSLEVLSVVLPAGRVRHFEAEEDMEHFITLPNLRSITLVGWPDINSILPHLVTPNLSCLHLRSSDDLLGSPDGGIGWCLLQFLERASPPLEELELRDADIPASYFIQCFARMNRLKTLRLHESEISDSVLMELYGPRGLCPSLSILDLRWCGHFQGQTLVNLVRSREPGTNASVSQEGMVRSVCAPIVKVTVIHCSYVQKRDIADLASLTLCQVVIVDSDDYCREYFELLILVRL